MIRTVALGLAATLLVVDRTESNPSVIKAGPIIVSLPAIARDRRGAPAAGLGKEAFVLLEDGREREIVEFASDTSPAAVAVIFDDRSMLDADPNEGLAAVRNFIDPRFAEHYVLVTNTTLPPGAFVRDPTLPQLLRGLLPDVRADRTPLPRLIEHTLPLFPEDASRRLAIVFTGTDPSSGADTRGRVREAVRLAQLHGVMVFLCVFDGTTFNYGLRNLAEGTGGALVRLKQSGELAGAMRGIADQLRSFYVLGFVPAKVDGKEHKIEVRVKAPNIIVHVRPRYVAA